MAYINNTSKLMRRSRPVHEIGRRIWARDLNIKKWAALNGFNYNTVQAVMLDKRGKWQAGKSQKIINALINQGFMTVEEAQARIKP
jgi:hypothetical protein